MKTRALPDMDQTQHDRKIMVYTFTQPMKRTDTAHKVQSPAHFQEMIRFKRTEVPRKIREWDLEPNLEEIVGNDPEWDKPLFEENEFEQFEFETIIDYLK